MWEEFPIKIPEWEDSRQKLVASAQPTPVEIYATDYDHILIFSSLLKSVYARAIPACTLQKRMG